MATEVSDNLTRLQVGFKRELIKEVKTFVVDAQMFRKDWEANGPMVPGLDPQEAVDRLRKFQQMFEVRACSAGGCGARGPAAGGWASGAGFVWGVPHHHHHHHRQAPAFPLPSQATHQRSALKATP